MKIWVNGCFDVLHVGHIRLFQYAKSLGTELRVGIDSDARVAQSKGEDKPVHTLDIRREVLESIKYIDDVVSFGNDHQLKECIQEYAPDLIVVGDDYRFKDVVGEELSRGVAFFKKIKGYSSSNILNHEKE